MMKLFLSVPVRTELELDVRYSASRPNDVIDAFARHRDGWTNTLKESGTFKTIASPDLGGQRLYSSLAEDSIPITLLPLISINWIVEKLSFDKTLIPGCRAAEVKRIIFHIYDRSLGILELALDIEDLHDREAFSQGVDAWSVTLAESVLNSLSPIYNKISSELTQLTKNDSSSTMRIISTDSSFFDFGKIISVPSRLSMLWVSRVLFTNHSQAEGWGSWTHSQINQNNKVSLDTQAAIFCVGNSIVFDEINLNVHEAICKGLRLSNLIYATVHVLCNNLRVIHGEFMSQKVDAERAAQLTSSIRGSLDLIEHDYEDSLLGVQGLRLTVVRNYLLAWSFDNLLRTSHRRLESVSALVKDAEMRRNLRYTKIVESVLTLIGGITLLDFTVNLMNFSRTVVTEDDGFWGLVDGAKKAPEDLVLWVLLGIVAGLALYKSRGKK